MLYREFAERLKRFERLNLLFVTVLVTSIAVLALLGAKWFEARYGRPLDYRNDVIAVVAGAILILLPTIGCYLAIQTRFAKKLQLTCANCRMPLVGSFGKQALHNDQCPVCGIAMLLERDPAPTAGEVKKHA